MSPAILAILSIIIGLGPIACALLASHIARAKKIRLDAAEAAPCIVFGVDISGALYTMFMMHWLAMFTLPLMVFGLIASLVWYLFK